MLSFSVYSNGKPVRQLDLEGAYLVGSDDVPVRAEIALQDGVINCKKRAAGPAGLAILWPVDGAGAAMVDTVRLPERKKPYVLQVELARARLMRIQHKLEDWGMLDFAGADDVAALVGEGREALIRALQADAPQDAAQLGDEAMALAVKASEALSGYHAGALLAKRKQAGAFGRLVFGGSLSPGKPTGALIERIKAAFDFVTLPIVWRDIEPSEQAFQWDALDQWVEALSKHHIAMKGSALLSFRENHVPDWLYIWEHDFDTIRDLAFEHARRVLERYGQYVQTWDVISGIHADNCFTFSFEQLMELTRMTAALAKQVCPKSQAIVELVAPWGEYYARNQRTIPPLLYADMTVQSGVNFDGFGLALRFGAGRDGMYVRDMFQVSSLLDQFVKLGKPVHVSAIQVPSGRAAGGSWHKPWSEETQAEWLRVFLATALSKPFVESMTWHGMTDYAEQTVPGGGLLSDDGKIKPAYEAWLAARRDVHAAVKTSSRRAPTAS